MNKLTAGFARRDITPPLGIAINGYYEKRLAEEVLDPLEVNCLALGCGDTDALLLSLDNLGICRELLEPIRQAVCQATGLPPEAVYIHCTHSHTAGAVSHKEQEPLNLAYRQTLAKVLAQAAQEALRDRLPAKMGYAVAQAPRVAFIRRFRMKDGSVRTNPGTNNPEILAPLGQVDERMGLLRFDREDGRSIVLMNFGNHPDTVGGCRLSADWPGFARRTLEQALPNTNALLFNGAQGDVNHINVHPTGGDSNDLRRDFDDVDRGYGHARHIGRVIAGAALQVYDKVCYTPVERLCCAERLLWAPANLPDPAALPQAREYAALHAAGKADRIPFTGMQLTTVVAEAQRMLRLEHGPERFCLPVQTVAIGGVALVGIPGEPFTGVGQALKEAPGWDLVLPTCVTAGYEGYFPMQEAYDEGGYEARSSNFRAGVAELLIRGGLEALEALRPTKKGASL